FNGNVGIGTTSLNISNKLAVNGGMELHSPGNDVWLTLSTTSGDNTSSNGTATIASPYWGDEFLGGDQRGDLDIWTENSNILFSADGWDPYLFISTTGNVGIGTTAPGGKLEIDTDETTNAMVLRDTVQNANASMYFTSPIGTAPDLNISAGRIITNGWL